MSTDQQNKGDRSSDDLSERIRFLREEQHKQTMACVKAERKCDILHQAADNISYLELSRDQQNKDERSRIDLSEKIRFLRGELYKAQNQQNKDERSRIDLSEKIRFLREELHRQTMALVKVQNQHNKDERFRIDLSEKIQVMAINLAFNELDRLCMAHLKADKALTRCDILHRAVDVLENLQKQSYGLPPGNSVSRTPSVSSPTSTSSTNMGSSKGAKQSRTQLIRVTDLDQELNRLCMIYSKYKKAASRRDILNRAVDVLKNLQQQIYDDALAACLKREDEMTEGPKLGMRTIPHQCLATSLRLKHEADLKHAKAFENTSLLRLHDARLMIAALEESKLLVMKEAALLTGLNCKLKRYALRRQFGGSYSQHCSAVTDIFNGRMIDHHLNEVLNIAIDLADALLKCPRGRNSNSKI